MDGWPPGNLNYCRQEERTGSTLQSISVLTELMDERVVKNDCDSGTIKSTG